VDSKEVSKTDPEYEIAKEETSGKSRGKVWLVIFAFLTIFMLVWIVPKFLEHQKRVNEFIKYRSKINIVLIQLENEDQEIKRAEEEFLVRERLLSESDQYNEILRRGMGIIGSVLRNAGNIEKEIAKISAVPEMENAHANLLQAVATRTEAIQAFKEFSLYLSREINAEQFARVTGEALRKNVKVILEKWGSEDLLKGFQNIAEKREEAQEWHKKAQPYYEKFRSGYHGKFLVELYKFKQTLKKVEKKFRLTS
jgi:hypothetical protein